MQRNLLLIFITLLILIAIPCSSANDNLTTELSDSDIVENIISQDLTDEITTESEEYHDTIYVSPDGNDDNNGNITNPTLSISKAIELASKEDNTAHKIIINEGNYSENELKINCELEIIGQGNVIIDANSNGRIITIDTEQEVKISKITFQNGKQMDGGAISINKAKVLIDNCKFINNTSDNAGAIYWNANNGILSNSYFNDNKGRKNSAAVCWGGISEEGNNFGDDGLIINTTFENNDNRNSETGTCMGLSINSNNVKVINSSFINNKGHFSTKGGSLSIQGLNISIINCLFENNTMSEAPAIQCDGDLAKIINCTFINNTIDNDGSAGAIEIQSKNALIYNNTFIENGGDECYNGGAIFINYIYDDDTAIINITNNKFIKNYAEYGAGIFINGGAETYCEFKSIIIDNNLFENSTAKTAAGIYILYVTIEEDENISTVIIKNNEFKNLVSYFSSAIHITSSSVLLKNNTLKDCLSIDTNLIYNNEGYISGNLTIIVNNNDTIELFSGRHTNITARLFDDNGNKISGGNLTLIVEDTYIREEGFLAEYGGISIDFFSTEYGLFHISADYLNGDKPNVKTSVIVSIPYNITINFNATEAYANNTISIPIQVIVMEGFDSYLLDNKNITLLFNGQEYDILVKNGIADVYLKLPENNGTYDLTVKYDIKEETKPITVKDNNVILSVPILNYPPHMSDLRISLKNIDGNPLINEKIDLIINNDKKTCITDENGEITVPLNLEIGKYPILVNYSGTIYKSANFKGELNIDYFNVILTGNDIIMDYKDGSSYIIRLTDSNQNPLINQNIIVKINSKIYNLKTDSNGLATLLIDLEAGKYIINTEYVGNSIYYPSSIKNSLTIKTIGKLTAKNINTYYTAKTSYKVRLYDAKGNAVGSGKIIKITLNGKTHNVKTDKNGYAIFSINLKPKTYTVKASYGKLEISNKIVIKSLLTAKDITKKKSKKIIFKAKLLNNKGKILKGKKITFKIKGKSYKVKTNKKGIAKLTLKNLKVGKYSITTKYEKSAIKNTIKIK